MRAILIIFCIALCFFSCNSQGDTLSNKDVVKLFSSTASEFGVGGEDLNKLMECLGQNFKNKYPNFPNGIKKSQLRELQELSKLSTIQCIKSGSLNLTLKWTPFLEKILYDKFYGLEELKSFDSEKRRMFTECVITSLKNQNPNGFSLKNGSANKNPAESPEPKCKNLLIN